MKAYTDYPVGSSGDLARTDSPLAEVEILTYDGDNYCKILFEGKVIKVETGKLFTDSNRNSKSVVNPIDLSRLPKELPSELILQSINRINIDDNNKNNNRIEEILVNAGYKSVTTKLKDKVCRLFCEVYIMNKNQDIDLHSTFASKLDISRSQARELAMRIYFDPKYVRLMSGSEDVISIIKNKES